MLRVERECRWWSMFIVALASGTLVGFKTKSHFRKRKKAVFVTSLLHAKIQVLRRG